ncbi:hypothetical protein GPECTOR_46g225 [Gonium pectorale]|uniref:Uncharacterized protein n=1 Tax=Gonium pectorale TaxID=33097 RepID=A0A150G8G7_GONPE|nr:hypothetical protein GPECTOR_46g225 [Gonium pectorale]|eukprot:KXZ46156.1 hypothetical protein GPECTOR_46g225 [Gonium pectorale]
MGLVTFSLLLGAALATAPLWFPLLLFVTFLPGFAHIVLGLIALLTAPLWIPLVIIGIPIVIITSPIWSFLLVLAIIF